MTSAQTSTPCVAGVYIHWPFCARKCPYCDFYTFGREHAAFDRNTDYLNVLLKEIESLSDRFEFGERPKADTIYFGGGTPSLMEPGELESVLIGLRKVFDFSSETEITLEVNPTAAEAERLKPARELGVNRLSIGCQSFDDNLLKLLGRDHDATQARRTLDLAREIGFDNISLDLMFGLPGQTLEMFNADITAALSFAPEHFSAYGLTYHAGTPFHRWREDGKLTALDSEIEADQFEALIGRLHEAGYEHYEISNWSKPDRLSRHNFKYWSMSDVFAFGVSSHGVVGGDRYEHPKDLKQYLAGDYLQRGDAKPESDRQRTGEIMMLALRRINGATWDELNEWCRQWGIRAGASQSIQDYYHHELTSLTEKGLIEQDRVGVRMTRKGLLLADDVALKFL